MILGGGALGGGWGQGVGLSGAELVPSSKRPQKNAFPHPLSGPNEKTAVHEPGSGFLPDTESAGTVNLDLQTPEP